MQIDGVSLHLFLAWDELYMATLADRDNKTNITPLPAALDHNNMSTRHCVMTPNQSLDLHYPDGSIQYKLDGSHGHPGAGYQMTLTPCTEARPQRCIELAGLEEAATTWETTAKGNHLQ